MTLSLAESILNSEARLGVVPAQRFLKAGEDAGSALQAAVWVGIDVAILVERVDLGWAHEEAVLRRASCSADFLVYLDVTFFVDFEYVPSKLLFCLQDFQPLYRE